MKGLSMEQVFWASGNSLSINGVEYSKVVPMAQSRVLSDGWRKFPEEDPATYIQPHGLFLVYAHHIDLDCHCFEIMSYFPCWVGEKWMRHQNGGGPINSDKIKVLAFRELVPPAFA